MKASDMYLLSLFVTLLEHIRVMEYELPRDSFTQGATLKIGQNIFSCARLELWRKHIDGGCEFDQLAVTLTGRSILFEHKGSYHGYRPGMMRTDTVKKALLSGFINQELSTKYPYHIVTSHIEAEKHWGLTRSLEMIDIAMKSKAVNAIWVIGGGHEDSNLFDFSLWHLRYFLRTGRYKGGFWNYLSCVSGRYHGGYEGRGISRSVPSKVTD